MDLTVVGWWEDRKEGKHGRTKHKFYLPHQVKMNHFFLISFQIFETISHIGLKCDPIQKPFLFPLMTPPVSRFSIPVSTRHRLSQSFLKYGAKT